MMSSQESLIINGEGSQKKHKSKYILIGCLVILGMCALTGVAYNQQPYNKSDQIVIPLRGAISLHQTQKLVSDADLVAQAPQPSYDPQGKYEILTDIEEGFRRSLKLNYTNPGEFYLKEKSKFIEKVDMVIHRESPQELTVRVSDSEGEIFNLPNEFPFPHTKDNYIGNEEDHYHYEAMKNGVQLRVFRKSGEKEINIFNTQNTKFVFSRLYTEFTTVLDTPYVWGLGDRRTMNFLLESGNYTVWNRDQSSIDKGQPSQQQYGTQPVWMFRDIEGHYHIIVVKSSNSMQIQYVRGQSLTFVIVGGIIELKFIVGGSDPREAINRYHRYVNGWALHPFWSVGWHQSRWGYKSSKELLEVRDNYTKFDLPLDIMWSDLDYMEKRKDFTIDEQNYLPSDLRAMTDKSDPHGVEWVPIIDPGVAVDSDCARRGLEANIFVQSTKQVWGYANGTNALTGWVWPGHVYYPDFNHPNTTEVWHSCFEDVKTKYNITFSGVWIDMNEYSNFVDGEADPNGTTETTWYANSSSEYNLHDLPFNPQGKDGLEYHAVSISAIHYNKEDAVYVRQKNGNLTELNLHAVNGFWESIATKESQRRQHNTNLTFVLTRSTFMGSGRFVQHWLGDNASTWAWLASSIGAIFNFNMYGIPMVGDDICGFVKDADDQLCARWIQLGSLYPFSRSHDAIDARIQEPWTFKPYVVETTRRSLELRYSLAKYYYTLFVTKYDKSLGAGVGTIFNPLFYLYNDDEVAITVDRQFVIGESLIVIPVVDQQNDTTLEYTEQGYYVPKGAKWYNLKTGEAINQQGNHTVTIGFDDTAMICINEGHIVPISNSTGIRRLRYLPEQIQLSIALSTQDNQTYTAQGQYLSIASYDEWNVEARCWNQDSSCTRDITVTGKSDGVTLQLKFFNNKANNDNSEEIIIELLNIYGVVKGDKYLPVLRVPVEVSSQQEQWRLDIIL